MGGCSGHKNARSALKIAVTVGTAPDVSYSVGFTLFRMPYMTCVGIVLAATAVIVLYLTYSAMLVIHTIPTTVRTK